MPNRAEHQSKIAEWAAGHLLGWLPSMALRAAIDLRNEAAAQTIEHLRETAAGLELPAATTNETPGSAPRPLAASGATARDERSLEEALAVLRRWMSLQAERPGFNLAREAPPTEVPFVAAHQAAPTTGGKHIGPEKQSRFVLPLALAAIGTLSPQPPFAATAASHNAAEPNGGNAERLPALGGAIARLQRPEQPRQPPDETPRNEIISLRTPEPLDANTAMAQVHTDEPANTAVPLARGNAEAAAPTMMRWRAPQESVPLKLAERFSAKGRAPAEASQRAMPDLPDQPTAAAAFGAYFDIGERIREALRDEPLEKERLALLKAQKAVLDRIEENTRAKRKPETAVFAEDTLV